jgi:hypothetical protein
MQKLVPHKFETLIEICKDFHCIKLTMYKMTFDRCTVSNWKTRMCEAKKHIILYKFSRYKTKRINERQRNCSLVRSRAKKLPGRVNCEIHERGICGKLKR